MSEQPSLLTPPAKKPAKPRLVTAADIRAGLQMHYPQPRYAVLFEVTDATGAQHTRSADAMVMSCWPSNGLDLTGFEIKVYRSDWTKELKQPQKAETIAAYCDRWVLVTGPGVVNDLSEVPQAWGWMVYDGKRFTLHREAARNPSPKAIDRLFLAALLRRIAKTDDKMLDALVEERMEALRTRNDEEVLRQVTSRSRDFVALQKVVADFEAASGIKLADDEIRGYFRTADGARIGRVVAALKDAGLVPAWEGLLNLEKRLRKTADQVGEARKLAGIDVEPELDETSAGAQRPAPERPQRSGGANGEK